MYRETRSDGMRGYVAAELVARGALRGCGCPDCSEILTRALAWERFCERQGTDRRGNPKAAPAAGTP